MSYDVAVTPPNCGRMQPTAVKSDAPKANKASSGCNNLRSNRDAANSAPSAASARAAKGSSPQRRRHLGLQRLVGRVRDKIVAAHGGVVGAEADHLGLGRCEDERNVVERERWQADALLAAAGRNAHKARDEQARGAELGPVRGSGGRRGSVELQAGAACGVAVWRGGRERRAAWRCGVWCAHVGDEVVVARRARALGQRSVRQADVEARELQRLTRRQRLHSRDGRRAAAEVAADRPRARRVRVGADESLIQVRDRLQGRRGAAARPRVSVRVPGLRATPKVKVSARVRARVSGLGWGLGSAQGGEVACR
jgi:hypothetical protein